MAPQMLLVSKTFNCNNSNSSSAAESMVMAAEYDTIVHM